MNRRRILPAVLVLLALLGSGFLKPESARAGEVPLLGARLDTSGTWVAVISKATIPTHVELSTEGDVHLDIAAFDIAPGERRQIAYTGTGLGWVSARMTPLDAPPGASTGALEVRAWVRYVPPPPPPALPDWLLLLPILGALLAILGLRRNQHAA